MNTDTRKTIRPAGSIKRTLAAWLRGFIRRNIVSPAPPDAPPAPPTVKKGSPGRRTAKRLTAPWPPGVGFRTVRAASGARYCQRHPDLVGPGHVFVIQMEPPK